MGEFETLRNQYRQANADVAAAVDRAVEAQERLRTIAREEAALKRRFDSDDRGQVLEARRLQAERVRAEADRDRGRADADAARTVAVRLRHEFGRFTDPREAVSRLHDNVPILLMPVRLETRFKSRLLEGRGTVPELWVRVFPDDCWLDTFDPTLTDTEVENARVYWTSLWAAGGIEAQQRAAWSALVESHGAGRAGWIIDHYRPMNVGPPVKPRPEDVILAIPSDTPLLGAEESAVGEFWSTVWLADGDAAMIDAARQALLAAVGGARAEELETRYRPANLEAPLAAGAIRATLSLAVAFVYFPTVTTKQSAWSRAPSFTLLPERFVFIGYPEEGEPLVEVGEPVPARVFAGPDPSAPQTDQLQQNAKGDLVVPPELQWLTDFDRAVADGMGFRVPLTPGLARAGFRRVLVLGVRISADEAAGRTDLESLLLHHANGRAGLAVIPQGTPTNNTEAGGSGHGRTDDPDQSFDDRATPRFEVTNDPLEKRDGQVLAEYLGIDPAILLHVPGAGTTDQRAARAMNAALWPATLGYWMETMLAPVFSQQTIDTTRQFFSRYVLGSGAIPAIRIGNQPYGILPATRLSQMGWLDQRQGPGRLEFPLLPYLRRLYPLLLAVDADLRTQLPKVSFVGSADDPHHTLLDILGLHSGSVEWSQRYAEQASTLLNRLAMQGFAGIIEAIIASLRQQAAGDLVKRLGYDGDQSPPILDLIFSGKVNRLKGGVVDDVPLSELVGIRAYTSAGGSYIDWLVEAAGTSLDALYQQNGFLEDRPPTALLYLMLRHALQLGYHGVSIKLHQAAGLYTEAMARAARQDDPFLHIREGAQLSESRYQSLYAIQPAITGSTTQTVGTFIGPRLGTLAVARPLQDQLASLDRLRNESTARLERVFADHVDCCAYRLDAWLLGLVNFQLDLMRSPKDDKGTPARGIFLGAYAWLEELKPEGKELTPVALKDPDLAAEFLTADQPPLLRDSTNEGYIHAPSLNHAITAAVLRNGYLSNASPANRQTLAVNLTSERVRTALGLLEGIRAGQGLPDLLGYQFERGLHDRYGLAEVDKFIFDLRTEFPLRLGRLKSAKDRADGPGDPEKEIAARNVVDGLSLVEHMLKESTTEYPFKKPSLPPATPAEKAAIDAEAQRLLESHDALADLALAEGVHQAVLGDYDRVASTYDAYARGNFPPEPDVIRTPLPGIGLTLRVALHLDPAADPLVSPIGGVAMTPRAQAEPAINQWLAGLLPPPDQVGCTVTFRRAASGAAESEQVTLKDLGLQPADLIAIVREDNQQAMTELDDRVLRFAWENFGLRPDVPVTIEYLKTLTAPFSIFQTMPLVRYARRLATMSRPLRATDLTLMNEARPEDDADQVVDKARLTAVQGAMQVLRADLEALRVRIAAPLADLDNRKAEILTDVDDYITDGTALLARAALFAMPQAGWGFAYDFKRRTFASILGRSEKLVERWNGRLDTFQQRLDEFDALPGTARPEAGFRILIMAEREITTTATDPLPATPALFRALLTGVTEPAFVARRDAFVALQQTTRTTLSDLLNDVTALLPVTDVDPQEFLLTEDEDAVVRFAQDLVGVIDILLADIDRRDPAAQQQFDAHDTAAAASEKVAALELAAKALLGDDCRVVPQFALSAVQGDEIANALAASRSGELFTHLATSVQIDFPVDSWLYGVARVRDKMHSWEQAMMLAGSLGRAEPALDPMQLPFTPGDNWLALEFPPGTPLDTDRLLYTAHFVKPFDQNAPQCGLLIDEWPELIPGDRVDTGLTFHYDRPNSEAPQAMLLATPSAFRGAWQWNDLVETLNETLDFAKRRALEPSHLEALPYAPLLPATIMATQVSQLTIAANLALNNHIALATVQA